MTRTIRVLLVDNQPTIRHGLRLRLTCEGDMDIAGEAGDGASAIELAQSVEPDVVVLDINMPGMDGFEVAQELRRLSSSGIVMLSMRDDATSRARAELSGAHAFVSKHESTDHLVVAIRQVADLVTDPGQITNGGP